MDDFQFPRTTGTVPEGTRSPDKHPVTGGGAARDDPGSIHPQEAKPPCKHTNASSDPPPGFSLQR
mgnify:CR=1 FL=1